MYRITEIKSIVKDGDGNSNDYFGIKVTADAVKFTA